jgi:hypothetical protein
MFHVRKSLWSQSFRGKIHGEFVIMKKFINKSKGLIWPNMKELHLVIMNLWPMFLDKNLKGQCNSDSNHRNIVWKVLSRRSLCLIMANFLVFGQINLKGQDYLESRSQKLKMLEKPCVCGCCGQVWSNSFQK